MALFEQFRGLDGWNLSYLEEMIETKQLRLPPGEESRMFVHAANMLNAIADESVVGRVYKTEDLTSSAETLAALVRDVSGGDIEPTAEWLASCLRSPRVNAHSTRQEWIPSDWQLQTRSATVPTRSGDRSRQLSTTGSGCGRTNASVAMARNSQHCRQRRAQLVEPDDRSPHLLLPHSRSGSRKLGKYSCHLGMGQFMPHRPCRRGALELEAIR